MTDFSQWQTKHVAATKLLLDPQNPRIPATSSPLAQRALIAELVEHDDVYDLAKQIVRNGYYPTEILIAVSEGGELYIVEGNRRLTALKLLLSPDSAPQGTEARFRTLSEEINPKTIEKVPVLVAPSRDAATPLIINRHTRTQVVKWSPTMQARFFRSLLDRGATVEDLSDKYGVPAAEISDFLRMDTMYELACSQDLPANILAQVQNPRTFPVTNLERALQSSHVRAFLGVDLDKDDLLVGKIDPGEFQKGFKKIVTDVANGTIDSRTLNDSKDIKDYLASFGDAAPDLSKRGSFVADDLIKIPKHKPMRSVAKVVDKKLKSTSSSVIPRGVKCYLTSDRISAVFAELRKLKIAEYPNSSAMMLRVLFELALSNFIDKSGKTDEMIKPFQAKGKPKDWYPSLRQQMEFILEKATDPIRLKPLQYKAVRKLQTDQDSPMSLDLSSPHSCRHSEI